MAETTNKEKAELFKLRVVSIIEKHRKNHALTVEEVDSLLEATDRSMKALVDRRILIYDAKRKAEAEIEKAAHYRFYKFVWAIVGVILIGGITIWATLRTTPLKMHRQLR